MRPPRHSQANLGGWVAATAHCVVSANNATMTKKVFHARIFILPHAVICGTHLSTKVTE